MIKLRELLAAFDNKPQDVDLYHWDVDEEFTTLVELSSKDFTECGREKFQKVLDAEVVSMKAEGDNWLSIFVKGVSISHVSEFCYSHAGHCSAEDYKRWFTMDKEGGDVS